MSAPLVYPQRPEEGVRLPGTGATYVCDLHPVGCWELLPEQQVLLTGSSLQPENLFLTVYFQVGARKKNPNQKTKLEK